MRILGTMALCAALGGCAAAPKMGWVRVDGQSSRDNPVLQTQFEVDRTACLGERNKAALSGVTVAGSGLAGAIAAQERTNAADTVGQGCMAEKGYLLVREDEADAKRAELARVAELKKQQEAAAAAPAPKQKKPASTAKPSS
ncbi:hypothetical protein GA0061099_1005403 [Bradyrhizobium yuanmingense]|uniref:Lipoprotein n=1 Tax=Bradyrhizobium yuanmingense TaxID=108015 RepID=A0A1C3W7X6_9BRAD|nr:hypothetical protein IQ15_02921 [Bradyrhizobium yuanmingense]SCB35975.1 hypothetical protein GA0061099_1005403 [Bradyrhizobium yuanmingense]